MMPPRVYSTTVHPRSRGEHNPTSSCSSARYGSSPLARGTRSRRVWRGRCQRFIPARAGNTIMSVWPIASSSVHPRSRGEHVVARTAPARTSGSSPLARGTLAVTLDNLSGQRFIPARAGNTLFRRTWPTGRTVHPRSRGEHRRPPRPATTGTGSSPLARGTHHALRPELEGHRFIPARAGNTALCESADVGEPVHPRSRGEHLVASATALSPAGSSPLARGTLLRGVGESSGQRFIPARAGNTRSGAPRGSR